MGLRSGDLGSVYHQFIPFPLKTFQCIWMSASDHCVGTAYVHQEIFPEWKAEDPLHRLTKMSSIHYPREHDQPHGSSGRDATPYVNLDGL